MLKISTRQGIILFSIAFFFLAAYVLISSNQLLQQSNIHYDKKEFAENYAKNLSIEFFENGSLKQQINAQAVDYFSHQIGAKMLQPMVKVYSPESINQPKWQITANLAQLYPAQSRIKMIDSVKLKQYSVTDITAVSSQLATDGLTIMLDKQVALSQESVKIKHSSTLIEGIGLKLDFKQQNYQILQAVRMRMLNDKI